MTIQNQEIIARQNIFAWIDTVEDRMEVHSQTLNSIDFKLRDIALDVLFNINEPEKEDVLFNLNLIKQYTGSPDLLCPTEILEVIANLKFLIGE